MKLNVEEELERVGDRFTCCLTNVSQGRAGISLMSSRLAAAPHSGEPSPPPAPPAVPLGPGSHKQPSTAKLINHCQHVGHHLHLMGANPWKGAFTEELSLKVELSSHNMGLAFLHGPILAQLCP